MLHRQFGSALREEVRLHASRDSWKVATDPHCNSAVERFLGRNAVLTVNREIIALLSKRYPAAYKLVLEVIESGDAGAALARSGGMHGVAARVLRNFGLLSEATLAIPEHLSWYVRTLLPGRMDLAV
jgi:hypothetical protein